MRASKDLASVPVWVRLSWAEVRCLRIAKRAIVKSQERLVQGLAQYMPRHQGAVVGCHCEGAPVFVCK